MPREGCLIVSLRSATIRTVAKHRSADGAIIQLAQEVRWAQLPSPAECRRIRIAAGVSLREAAAPIGVDAMTLWRWENGRARPRREHAMRYRKLLDALEG